MITFSIECRRPGCRFRFDGMFPSGAEYDRQQESGLVECPACGSSDTGKALMAPAVVTTRGESKQGASVLDQLRELRRMVEKESEHVGSRFAEQALAMHEGRMEHRVIHGAATAQETSHLIEKGVEFAEIPWVPLHDA